MIATSESLQSEWVGREVEKFGALGRPIIPINIQGALNEAPLEGTRFEVLKRKDIVWIDESTEIFCTGHPTDEVLRNLRRLFVWRRAKRYVQTLIAAVVVMREVICVCRLPPLSGRRERASSPSCPL